jgi:hypothetical protein
VVHLLHFGFYKKYRFLSRKKETTIQSKTKFDIIDLMQVMDQGDFGNHNNTGVKIVYQYCKVFQNFCIVMDVYLLMCVITTDNV